jgi:hypothetical protein
VPPNAAAAAAGLLCEAPCVAAAVLGRGEWLGMKDGDGPSASSVGADGGARVLPSDGGEGVGKDGFRGGGCIFGGGCGGSKYVCAGAVLGEAGARGSSVVCGWQ